MVSKLNNFIYSWRIVMILYYLVVFVLCVWFDQVLHLVVKMSYTIFPTLCTGLTLIQYLNMINWIRYPSKPDHQADHDNNQTVLPQAGKELSELL